MGQRGRELGRWGGVLGNRAGRRQRESSGPRGVGRALATWGSWAGAGWWCRVGFAEGLGRGKCCAAGKLGRG